MTSKLPPTSATTKSPPVASSLSDMEQGGDNGEIHEVDEKPNIETKSHNSKMSHKKTKKERTLHEEESEGDLPLHQRLLNLAISTYHRYDFLCLILVAICLARVYPPLGADYVRPDITATWLCVMLIFVIVGLGLKTEAFSKAIMRVKFNAFVQLFNFGVVSALVFGVSRGLRELNVISQPLADGMVVCSTFPATINIALVLTKTAGGDEAAAVFNGTFANMISVFLSPLLILAYLGVSGNVELGEVFYKLALRIVLPSVVGQLLQKYSNSTVAFYESHKWHFKTAQMAAMAFIVYTVFCRTFLDEGDSNVGDVFVMIAVQVVLYCFLMIVAWYSLRLLFRDEPTLRAMGLFGCTHKAMAIGIPLINSIYENDPLVGLYTLPLLIWHPSQLIIGSLIAPKLHAWVLSEKERLGIMDDEEEPLTKSPRDKTVGLTNRQKSERKPSFTKPAEEQIYQSNEPKDADEESKLSEQELASVADEAA